jgi:hypothetical protein
MLKNAQENETESEGEIFRYLKSKGVDDPEVDLWIAVTSDFDNVEDAKKALDAGANPHVTSGELFRRYESLVTEYRSRRSDDRPMNSAMRK